MDHHGLKRTGRLSQTFLGMWALATLVLDAHGALAAPAAPRSTEPGESVGAPKPPSRIEIDLAISVGASGLIGTLPGPALGLDFRILVGNRDRPLRHGFRFDFFSGFEMRETGHHIQSRSKLSVFHVGVGYVLWYRGFWFSPGLAENIIVDYDGLVPLIPMLDLPLGYDLGLRRWLALRFYGSFASCVLASVWTAGVAVVFRL